MIDATVLVADSVLISSDTVGADVVMAVECYLGSYGCLSTLVSIGIRACEGASSVAETSMITDDGHRCGSG